MAHREEVLESLQVIVRKSIKQILEAKVYFLCLDITPRTYTLTRRIRSLVVCIHLVPFE